LMPFLVPNCPRFFPRLPLHAGDNVRGQNDMKGIPVVVISIVLVMQ